MSLKLRGGFWWVDISVDGKRLRKSTGTADRKAAQELHDKWQHELWRTSAFGETARMSWQDAAVHWVKERSIAKRSIKDDISKLRKLDPFLRRKYLDEIDFALIQAIVEELVRNNATRNRYVALVRAILTRANQQWMALPHIPSLPEYEENAPRVRYISRQQADRLIAELPPHLKDIVEFALQTGLRAENVLGLEWQWVHLQSGCLRPPGTVMKNKMPLTVPLTDVAISILEARQGEHPTWVFTYSAPRKDGQTAPANRIQQIKTDTWRNACERAEIEDFRFHDLRHTWASWMVMRGASLQELMVLGGWSSYDMVLRYAHLSPSHLARTAAAKVPAPGEYDPG